MVRCKRQQPHQHHARLPLYSRGMLVFLLLSSLISTTAQLEGVLGTVVDTLYQSTPNRSMQKYSLFFTLDGPTGDGSFRDPSQVQQFVWFMQNLTFSFVPLFATTQDVQAVKTVCRYITQKSFDQPPDLPLPEPGAVYYESTTGSAPSTRSFLSRQDDLETLSQLFGNTTYGIQYSMNYTSDPVNVENYTTYYEYMIYRFFPVLEVGLRSWLNVPSNSNLTIQGVYVSRPQSLRPPLNTSGTSPPLGTSDGDVTVEETPNDLEGIIGPSINDTLGQDNFTTFPPVFGNTSAPSVAVPATPTPSAAPTATTSPSALPSVSSLPTSSAAPSLLPSSRPTRVPSSAPSGIPSTYPTFTYNSTARGRYDFVFTMTNVSNPLDMSLNTTLTCELMSSLTPLFAPPEHNPEQVVTTCPTIDGGFSFYNRPQTSTPDTPLEPGTGPAPAPDDDLFLLFNEDFHDDDNATAITYDDELDDSNNVTQTRNLLRGGPLLPVQRQLANITIPVVNVTVDTDTDTDTDANITPRVLWTYTIVMRWESAHWDVSEYPDLLEAFVDDNTEALADALEEMLGLDDTQVQIIQFRRVFEITKSPTSQPTSSPSESPTYFDTDEPTFRPTLAAPTIVPGSNGTDPIPGVSGTPTTEPQTTTSPQPASTLAPADSRSEATVIVVVVVVVIFVSSILVAGLFLFYRRRKDRKKELANTFRRAASGGSAGAGAANFNPATGGYVTAVATAESISPSTLSDSAAAAHEQPVPPSKLLTEDGSNNDEDHHAFSSTRSTEVPSAQPKGSATGVETRKVAMSSLLSDIEEDPYSSDDNDEPTTDDNTTQSPPVDEFERYKDRNLEKMRTNVEDNVTGMDDMMSQAMTMALMMDEGSMSASAPYWHGAKTGVEIEANALWEVTEWLKRQDDSVAQEDKHMYMQGLLNKMVTSVRKGIVDPEDASRTIHECAALLGLELANQLPVTTIILSGMQKSTKSSDVMRTFQAFGPIESVAVASNQRGFGLVRFKNQKAAMDAMQRYRVSEIVVKNVAITLKMLSPLTSHKR